MKVSDEESTLLTGAKSYEQAAEEILAMGPKLVAITLGEHGVLMATKSRKEIIKAFKTQCSRHDRSRGFILGRRIMQYPFYE